MSIWASTQQRVGIARGPSDTVDTSIMCIGKDTAATLTSCVNDLDAPALELLILGFSQSLHVRTATADVSVLQPMNSLGNKAVILQLLIAVMPCVIVHSAHTQAMQHIWMHVAMLC